MNDQNKENLCFGKRLATLRKQKGYSQTAFGKQLGLTKRAVSYYENRNDFPSSDILTKICTVLEMPLEALVKDQIEPEQGSVPKLWKKLRNVENLSPKDQKTILNMIDSLLKK